MEFTILQDENYQKALPSWLLPFEFTDRIMRVIKQSPGAPNDQDHCGMTIHELAEEDESLVINTTLAAYNLMNPELFMKIGRLQVIGIDGDCPYCGAWTTEVWEGYTKRVTCLNERCDYHLEDALTEAEYYEP